MSPLVSVVMPLYNKERQVIRAVRSLLSQRLPNFELVVVNDGSTDAGPELVRKVQDQRIRMVSQANTGVSAARNRGIELARSGTIAFLDADDEWHPGFLQKVFYLAQKFPECSVFATNYYVANAATGTRHARICGLPPNFQEGVLTAYFEIASQSDPPLWTSAIAVRRTAIRSIGGFPVGVTKGEDLLTWARLAVDYKIAYSSTQLATHWEPEDVLSRPGRVPQFPDHVGNELTNLIDRCGSAQPAGIKEYLALWFRMRGVIFLQLANSLDARLELRKAMQIAGMRTRLMTLFAIALLPGPWARFTYSQVRRMNVIWTGRN